MIICRHCGTENVPTNRFCTNCAQPLGHRCRVCGYENAPESKFCGNCGSRLEEAQAEDAAGERRQLTVLFCDVVGSTELSRKLDPEDLGVIIGRYQQACNDAVRIHEGHVAQYLGDGVVVYFGYPKAHEDDARRALRCGLDVLARIEELRSLGEFGDVHLEVRLGVHTGRVVVGPVGAGERKERIALGDTPNIAARVQAEAPPGALAVSEDTWRMVAGFFSAKSMGERTLKGVAEPTPIWLIEGESGSMDRLEAAGRLTSLVGRDEEQRLIDAAWQEVLSGDPQFLHLHGDAGMGKSRLALLARTRANAEGARALTMRATPYSQTSPFQPVIEFLTTDLGIQGDDAQRLVALEALLQASSIDDSAAIPLLATMMSLPVDEARYPSPSLSSVRARTKLMDLLVEILAAAAAQETTMVLVEDLHWADASTIELVELTMDSVRTGALLMITTGRPEFAFTRPHTNRFQVIEIGRLDRDAAETLIRSVANEKALPSEISRGIIDRAEGVPLFLEELTSAVLDSGVLVERTASWEATGTVTADTIPASIDASLTARIDRLGASRATAQLAATIGREFDLSLLHAVSERDAATIDVDLERLLTAGMILPPTGSTYLFNHALVRDAAYNSLLRSTRQMYHKRIAEALLEGAGGDRGKRPELIADHLTRAGDFETAVDLWEQAGDQALGLTAVFDASHHLERAIASIGELPATPENQERELLLQIKLAPLLMTVYGWGSDDAETACRRALELAQALQRYDLYYPPLWGLWTVHFLRGEMDEALETANQVLEMAIASGVPMLEMTGRHASAYTKLYRAEFDAALEEADKGLALYAFDQEKELADTFLLSSTVCLRTTRATALWMLGQVDEALAEGERMIDLARKLGHVPSLAAALAFYLHLGGYRYSYLDQMYRLAGTADELVTLCKEEGFFLWQSVGQTYRGAITASEGEPALARTQMQEGWELFLQTGARLTEVLMNVIRAEAMYRLGDDEEGLRVLDEAADAMNNRSEALFAPEIERVRGRILAKNGELMVAETAYRAALALAGSQGALSLELRAALDLHELLRNDDEGHEAMLLLADVLARFTEGLDQPEVMRAARLVASMR